MAATDTITFTYTLNNGTTGTQSFTGDDNCQQLQTYMSNIGKSNIKSATLSGNGSGSANQLFLSCSSLTSLNVSNFNTSNITIMSSMFYSCTSLTSLDLSNFDTSNVTNMDYMFRSSDKLTSINVSNFDTSNVTSMNFMFQYCSALTSLDVSSFDTSKVTSMAYMFYQCSALTTIYCNDDWKSSTTSGSSMFTNCTNLIGAISYDKSKTNINYANPTTGYFTKIYKVKLECTFTDGSSVVQTFTGTNNGRLCANYTQDHYYEIKYAKISGNMYGTTLDQWAEGMFASASNLEIVDVSELNVDNVTTLNAMFLNCSKLTTIYCNDDWSSISGSSMFSGCTKLVGAIPYNSGKTSSAYANPTTGYFTKPVAAYDVFFNETQLEHIYFNGTEIEKLYFNDTLIYPITTPHIKLGNRGTTSESSYTWGNLDSDVSRTTSPNVNIYTGIKLFDDDNVAANVQATIKITSSCGTTSRDGETHQVTTDSNGFAYFSTTFTTAQSYECGTYYINVYYGSKTAKNTITLMSM